MIFGNWYNIKSIIEDKINILFFINYSLWKINYTSNKPDSYNIIKIPNKCRSLLLKWNRFTWFTIWSFLSLIPCRSITAFFFSMSRIVVNFITIMWPIVKLGVTFWIQCFVSFWNFFLLTIFNLISFKPLFITFNFSLHNELFFWAFNIVTITTWTTTPNYL